MAENNTELSIADLRTALKTGTTPTPAEGEKTPETSESGAIVIPDKPITADETKPAEETKPAAETTTEETKPAEKKQPKRFSELTAKIREAEVKAAEAGARAEALAKELEAAKSGKTAEPATDAGKPKAPDATNFNGTWQELEAAREKYAEDLADWKANQKVAANEAARAKAEESKAATERLKGWQSRVDVLLDEHQEVMQEALQSVGKVVTKLGIEAVVMESEVGPDIVLALHNDAAALEKLAKMSIASAAREIGKIEAAILGKKAPTAGGKAPLPKPPQAVGGAASGSSATPDIDKLDIGALRSLVQGARKK